MRPFKPFLAISATILLAGCGTLVDGPTQKITLLTPGAYSAACTFDNGVKYHVVTGETIDIMRSGQDIDVDCYASGDRHRTRKVEAGYNGTSTASNLLVAPAVYDHFAGGLYEYQPVVVVDFSGQPVMGFEKPQYEDRDTPDPRLQAIENYAPSTIKTVDDTKYLRKGLQKSDASMSSNPFANVESSAGLNGGSSPSSSQSPSGTTADGLTRSMNPSVFNH